MILSGKQIATHLQGFVAVSKFCSHKTKENQIIFLPIIFLKSGFWRLSLFMTNEHLHSRFTP